MSTTKAKNQAQGLPVKVYVPGRPTMSWEKCGPWQPLKTFWLHRALIYQLSKREIVSRYKGSILGLAWSFVTPLLMLAVYTFVFSVVFEARWSVPAGRKVEFALILFAGLTIYQIFSECIARAPMLLLENPSYIKRIVFPLEILGWIVLVGAVFNGAINLLILFLGYILFVGSIPLTALWLPVVVLPFLIFVLGLTWFLAPLGVYFRDTRQIVSVLLPVVMFASPLFYPLSSLPASAQVILGLSPIAFTMEQLRAVALFGITPDFFGLTLFFTVSLLTAWAGFVFFIITGRGFADVI